MFTVSQSVRSTAGADGGVVLDVDRGQLFRLNPVAALILDMLTRRCPEREIVQEIAGRYSIAEEAAGADLGEFLLLLEQSNLIHRDAGEPAW